MQGDKNTDVSVLHEQPSPRRMFSNRRRGIRGLSGYLVKVLRASIGRRFDRRHGVDTSGLIAPKNVLTDSANKGHGHEYAPVPAKSLRFMLDTIPGDLQHYTFVNYGCGKGRSLLIAGPFFYSPFQTAVLQPVLDRIADSYFPRPRAIVILFLEDKGTLPIPTHLFENLGFLKVLQTPPLPIDLGSPYPLEYVLWSSPEALRDNDPDAEGKYKVGKHES